MIIQLGTSGAYTQAVPVSGSESCRAWARAVSGDPAAGVVTIQLGSRPEDGTEPLWADSGTTLSSLALSSAAVSGVIDVRAVAFVRAIVSTPSTVASEARVDFFAE